MAEQQVPVEVNNFKAGLVTDANPINFPQNAVKEISNITIDPNGKNSRRLGMDYETQYGEITTSQSSSGDVASFSFKWENVSGDSDKSLLVVQIGNEIEVIDLDSVPISAGSIYNYTFTEMTRDTVLSFDQVDSYLVAVNGDGNIYSFEYDSTSETVSLTSDRLLVRDLWGVEDISADDGLDLRKGNNVVVRPATLTDQHLYNLRNQTFGSDVFDADAAQRHDPVYTFSFQSSDSVYPSNSDSVNYASYPNPADTSRPFLDQYWSRDAVQIKVGSFETERGYFIIDALTRGASRLAVEASNRTNNPALSLIVSDLPRDETTGGATIVTQFGGRAMFAGFHGELIDGDDKSPNLSSFILFSQLVKDTSDITNCYQKADPTSGIDSSIAATDGGFIRIDGCHNIVSMKATASSLVVVARNGVWRVVGGNDYGFSADNYRVEKLSDEGCSSPNSVVYFGNTVMYWGDNGIYATGTSQLGDWKVQNVIQDRIQNLYDLINIEDKRKCIGLYDSYDRKVRWIYNNSIGSDEATSELIYDTELNAFYKNDIATVSGGLPKVISVAKSNPFVSGDVVSPVTVNGVQVTENGVDMNVTTQLRTGNTLELVYITVTQRSPVIKYTISKYRNSDFVDWETFDGTGVDAFAYMVTGALNTGDNQRRKKANSLMLHMDRTESGMVDDPTYGLIPDNPSSCLVQAQWDWSNSANSNKWSRPRQFYRYKRHYIPVDVNDTYDTGFETVVAKDIIRGHGKALSLKFYSEPRKDLRINGWSMIWGVGDNEGD